ncbi:MAG: uroporphyrinogen-III synthase [Rhodoferax sp.]|nr:uroporphyrinogen-III synthase [Rhodoferax sp.]
MPTLLSAVVRVIVTRPASEAHAWCRDIEAAGHSTWGLPLIELRAAREVRALEAARARIQAFDAVMFVSPSAVHFFCGSASGARGGPLVWRSDAPRALVTGPGSFSALQQCGVPATLIDMPDASSAQFDSEALWQAVHRRIQPGYRVLIVRGHTAGEVDSREGTGRDWFADQVLQAGGHVERVLSYERWAPQWSAATKQQVELASRDGSVWVFSSSEAIRNLQVCGAGMRWDEARAVVTHPRIATAARHAGFGVVREARPVLAALLASIESLR